MTNRKITIISILLMGIAGTINVSGDAVSPSVSNSTSPKGTNLEFDDLIGWKPVNYPTVLRSSSYDIQSNEDGSYLWASSRTGISGIVFVDEINILATPRMTWRWRITTFPVGATPDTKKLDDFALRVYVMFFKPASNLSLRERLSNRLYKTLYGYEPPSRILAYVWSEGDFDAPFQSLVNERVTYIDAVVDAQTGRWRVSEVDVAADYRRLFGEDPPATSRVAIISDSDSTGAASDGSIDYIRFTDL